MHIIPNFYRRSQIIFFSLTELVVGFEEETYMFSEPGSGEGVRVVMVCVVVSGGVTTAPIRVPVRFTDGTATGELELCVCMCVCVEL